MMNIPLKMVNVPLKMMNIPLKMMNIPLKMMVFVLEMMNIPLKMMYCTDPIPLQLVEKRRRAREHRLEQLLFLMQKSSFLSLKSTICTPFSKRESFVFVRGSLPPAIDPPDLALFDYVRAPCTVPQSSHPAHTSSEPGRHKNISFQGKNLHFRLQNLHT